MRDGNASAIMTLDNDVIVHGVEFFIKDWHPNSTTIIIATSNHLTWAGVPKTKPTHDIFMNCQSNRQRYLWAILLGGIFQVLYRAVVSINWNDQFNSLVVVIIEKIF